MLEAASDASGSTSSPIIWAKPTEFVIKHIPTEDSPRGVRISADGKTAFVANSLDDSVTVIDIPQTGGRRTGSTWGPEEITEVRCGEQLFHSANITFHRQFSCHSCHPDGHVDGLTYDIEPDGIGSQPGRQPHAARHSRHGALQVGRHQPEPAAAVRPAPGRLLHAIQPVHARRAGRAGPLHLHDPPAAEPLSAAGRRTDRGPTARQGDVRADADQRRAADPQGESLRHLPLSAALHRSPASRRRHEDAVRSRSREFDVPHLNNIYDSAPYLHNGIAETLEEIWTKYNPYDEHGVTNDMTKDQLNDLIEYLKTL